MDNDNQKIISTEQEEKQIYTGISNFKEEYEAKHAVWFLIGLALSGMGLFLVFQNTVMFTNFSLMDLLGFNPPFGIVLLPLIIGIGVLFFNEKSPIGWILVILGLATIILGIIMGLKIFFKPVTLYEGLLMFGFIAAGIGMMAKALAGRKA